MKNVKIPSASEMAELSTEKQKAFEKTVLEGPLLRNLVRNIEEAALEGKTKISITIDNFEHKQSLSVIEKTLKAAGYTCKFEGLKFPFNVIPVFIVSW